MFSTTSRENPRCLVLPLCPRLCSPTHFTVIESSITTSLLRLCLTTNAFAASKELYPYVLHHLRPVSLSALTKIKSPFQLATHRSLRLTPSYIPTKHNGTHQYSSRRVDVPSESFRPLQQCSFAASRVSICQHQTNIRVLRPQETVKT